MQTAIKLRRALDYLCSRSDIDSTRIGLLGLSMGGAITFALSSIDPRIKTAVAGLTPILPQPEFKPWMPTTFAHHVNSDSFLMFMGTKDTNYNLSAAKQTFKAIPIPGKNLFNTTQTILALNTSVKYQNGSLSI